jgi:3-hydroxy-3-methylglutaryl CoA synthase
MKAVGIEKVFVYPTTLALDIEELCRVRGFDAGAVARDFQVEARGLNPPWEDPVTMAVNAAKPMLTAEDRAAIGLLIVTSESSIDNEKPLSSWVHKFLGLPPDCRNFEIKHACYGATAAVQMALAWLVSGLAGDRKALIINADHSLIAPRDQAYEAVMGTCAVAILLSDRPRLITYELERRGVHAFESADVFRPTPRLETGNGEMSLLSYFEGLEGAFANYAARAGAPVDAWTAFDWYVYHMPFPGMAARAHRCLLSQTAERGRADVAAHFERTCAPTMTFARRMSGTYGASTFIGLLSLVESGRAKAGDRVGIFAYGSGSCAELQSARMGGDAAAVAQEAGLAALLDARRPINVQTYDAMEDERDAAVMARDYVPSRAQAGDLFATCYTGKGLLILDRVADHVRHYAWS